MAILLVTYELNTPNKEYGAFYETIKNSSSRWWHYLDVVWLIETEASATEVAKKLYSHMTQSDRLLVVKVANEYQGWLSEEAWQWMGERQY